MSFLGAMEVAASGLRMQRTRMNVISSNLANVETTRTPEGGPYRRRQVVVEAMPLDDVFGSQFREAVQGVRVQEVQADQQTPLKTVFDPSHPDANPQGYVDLPNVNVMEEMVDMMTASRGFEANATAFDTLKTMAQRALRIGEG